MIRAIQKSVRDWSLDNFPPEDVGGAVPPRDVKTFMDLIRYVGRDSHRLLKAEQSIRGGLEKLRRIGGAFTGVSTYSELASDISRRYGRHSWNDDFDGYDESAPEWQHKLLGIVEECGELVEAIEADDTDEVEDALGDIFIFLCDLASSLDIDLEDAIEEALDEVLERDWTKEQMEKQDIEEVVA